MVLEAMCGASGRTTKCNEAALFDVRLTDRSQFCGFMKCQTRRTIHMLKR